MRILFWSESFWPLIGGVEVLAPELIRSLQERGHEVMVVTDGLEEARGLREDVGLSVVRLPLKSALLRQNPLQILQIKRQVSKLKQNFKPDLVHIFHSGPSIFFHQSTTELDRTTMLFTLHSAFPPPELAADSVRGRVLRSADWVTACSAAVLKEVIAQVPVIGSRASVVHNCLPAPALEPLPLPFDPPRLLCIGRLVSEKGFDVSLGAFARVLRLFPRAQLRIAGDGSLRPLLQQQAADLGITASVTFLGWVSPERVPDLLNQSTLVLVPSRSEAFGLSALQAGQMARPVIATRAGGLPEVVVHAQTGLLVENEDCEGLSQAISFLLEQPELARQMGQAAKRRANAVFNWRHYVQAHEDLYQHLLGRAEIRRDAAELTVHESVRNG